MAYYAVAKGKKPGIYEDWTKCKPNVHRVKGAKYKKFNELHDAFNFISKYGGLKVYKKVLKEYGVPIEDLQEEQKKEKKDKNKIVVGEGKYNIGDGEGIGEENRIKIGQSVGAFGEAYENLRKNEEISFIDKDEQLEFLKSLIRSNHEILPGGYEVIEGMDVEEKERDKHMEDYSKIKDDELIVYVDGSFSDKYDNFAYGAVLIDNKGKVLSIQGVGSELELYFKDMRNVAGELKASLEAIRLAIKLGYRKVYLHYDYSGIEKWATGEWEAKKDGTILYAGHMKRYMKDLIIEFIKVKGHDGIKYNELADKLAGEAYTIHNDEIDMNI